MADYAFYVEIFRDGCWQCPVEHRDSNGQSELLFTIPMYSVQTSMFLSEEAIFPASRIPNTAGDNYCWSVRIGMCQ